MGSGIRKRTGRAMACMHAFYMCICSYPPLPLHILTPLDIFYRFRAANLLANSSTSGIFPPTALRLAEGIANSAALLDDVPPSSCFFHAVIFTFGFRCRDGADDPVNLTRGCKLSVLGLGGAILTGDLGPPKSRGGVARLSSSVVRGSSRLPNAADFAFCPPPASSSSSSNSGGGLFPFLGQLTPYVLAISIKYNVTSSPAGGSTHNFLSTRSATLPSRFSIASRAKSLPYFSINRARAV